MDTWYKIAALAPYIGLFFYGVAYFFKKKDKKRDDDHELLIYIKNSIEQIEIEMKSQKGHLIHIDIEQDVHERWFLKLCEGIRNMRLFHKTYHKEDDVPLDLERPEPLKIQ